MTMIKYATIKSNFSSQMNLNHKKIKYQLPLQPIVGVFLSLLLTSCAKNFDEATLLAQAQQYQQKGDLNSAIIQLKNVLQHNPNNGEVRVLLGSLFEQTEDLKSAENELRKAESAGVTRNRLAPLIGKVLLEQGEFQKALDETFVDKGVAYTYDSLVIRGNAFMGIKQLDRGRICFEQALTISPDSPGAIIGLGRIAAYSKNYVQATTLAEAAVTKNPTDIDALIFKGDMYRLSGKTTESLQIFEKIVSLYPKKIKALLSAANANIDAQKYDVASEILISAKKIRPGNLSTFYLQARLDINQGKNSAALESLQQIISVAPDYIPALLLAAVAQNATGQLEQAENNLRKYVIAQPENLYARKLLASVLLKTGQTELAAPYLDSALNDAPEDPQLLMMVGEKYLQENEFVKAAQYFEAARKIKPEAAIVHTALALSNIGKGDNAKAVTELELAASLDEKTAKVGFLLVLTQLKEKQYEKAMQSVTNLEKKYPKDPQVQNLKGGVFMAMGDFQSARSSFEKALTFSPTYMPAVENLVRLDLKDKNPSSAKKRYETVLRSEKQNIPAMVGLASIAGSNGQIGEVTSWLEKAVELNPDAVAPSLQLGFHYLKIGSKDKALALARNLSAANGTNADVFDFLGQCQVANRDFTAALTSFQKVTTLKPKSVTAILRVALVQLEIKNDKDAEESLKKALAIEPYNIEAHVRLVGIRVRAGDFDSAIKIVREVQMQRPKEPYGFEMEGDVWMAQKNPSLGMISYRQAMSFGKTSHLLQKQFEAMSSAGKVSDADKMMLQYLKETPGDVSSRVYLAANYGARHLNKASIEQYEIALQTVPKSPVLLNNLAYAYLGEKDPRALETAEKALRLDPDAPLVMDTVGFILVETGGATQGVDLLRKAIAKMPENNEIRLHLAVGLMKVGDKVGAKKELEKLSKLVSFSGMDDVKRLLKDL